MIEVCKIEQSSGFAKDMKKMKMPENFFSPIYTT